MDQQQIAKRLERALVASTVAEAVRLAVPAVYWMDEARGELPGFATYQQQFEHAVTQAIYACADGAIATHSQFNEAAAVERIIPTIRLLIMANEPVAPRAE